ACYRGKMEFLISYLGSSIVPGDPILCAIPNNRWSHRTFWVVRKADVAPHLVTTLIKARDKYLFLSAPRSWKRVPGDAIFAPSPNDGRCVGVPSRRNRYFRTEC